MATTDPSPPNPRTRLMPPDAIRQAGVDFPRATSYEMNWSGVEAHRYRLPAGETKEHAYPHMGIFLSHVEQPVSAELFAGGERRKARLDGNTISIMPAGVSVRSRWDRPIEVTSIFIEASSVMEIARQETGRDLPEVRMEYGIRDPLIRSIGMMLDAELFAEHPSPRIYAESLATALAAQIYAKHSRVGAEGWKASGGHAGGIRRSIDFIQANLHRDVTLAEAAAVANMSKYHFAKSFRQMTGVAPHQYLVKVRVEKARRMLADEKMSVEEIASRVGYADKGHFSAQFLKIVGVSPSRYRLAI